MKKYIIAILIIGIGGAVYLAIQPKRETDSTPITTKVYVDIPADTLLHTDLGVSNDVQPATEVKGGFTGYKTFECPVKSADLHIFATVEGQELDPYYDDIYLLIGNGANIYSGHTKYITDSKSPINLEHLLLYPVGRPEEAQSYNLLPLLNSGKQISFNMFISSARGDRSLSATLEYVCQN